MFDFRPRHNSTVIERSSHAATAFANFQISLSRARNVVPLPLSPSSSLCPFLSLPLSFPITRARVLVQIYNATLYLSISPSYTPFVSFNPCHFMQSLCRCRGKYTHSHVPRYSSFLHFNFPLFVCMCVYVKCIYISVIYLLDRATSTYLILRRRYFLYITECRFHSELRVDITYEIQ